MKGAADCDICGEYDCRINETVVKDIYVRRTRICNKCSHTWSTLEFHQGVLTESLKTIQKLDDNMRTIIKNL